MRYVKRPPARPATNMPDPAQAILDLRIDRQTEIDGIGMGVLSDGTPFLNQRGLARMCGVENAHIGTISSDWQDEEKPRVAIIKRILAERNMSVQVPHIKVVHAGRLMFAYPEAVCLAVLEYYAFEAGSKIQPEALARFRWLAGRSLREIIYTQLGYAPDNAITATWRQFHDRVSLVYDNVPAGYFCVFKEIADLMVTLINAGAAIGDKFVPDISVGLAWSKHWQVRSLSELFGERSQYEHNYPEYFPQAQSNPQTPFCYPDAALPEFRKWMRETYLPSGLPAYLDKKSKAGYLPTGTTKKVINAINHRSRSSISKH